MRGSKKEDVTISDPRQSDGSSHRASIHFEGAMDAKPLRNFKRNQTNSSRKNLVEALPGTDTNLRSRLPHSHQF